MAKQIVTIRCPQCGSTQQSQIKNDHYKCSDCGTEYILDNESVSVNVKHEYVTQSKPTPPKKLISILLAVIALLAVLFVVILFNSIATDNKPTKSKGRETINERFSGATIAHYSSKPIILFLSERNYGVNYNDKNNPKNGLYLVFYDLKNDAYLKDYKLDNISSNEDRNSITYRQGYLIGMKKDYVILNETNILEIDFENLSFKDVTNEMFGKFEEFDAGIATIDFDYQEKDNALRVVTNLGKSFKYYPYINHLHDSNIRDQPIDQNKLVDSTYYTFTEKTSYFPEMPIQLMRVAYKYNIGGPSTKPSTMEWKRDYYSNIPDAKILEYYYKKYVKSVEDVTPERNYFEPKILYQNNKTLLIKYKPTVAPNAPTMFQLLNLETNEPIWTQQLPASIDFRYIQEVGRTDKYYVISQGLMMFHLIPIDGGEIESFKVQNRH